LLQRKASKRKKETGNDAYYTEFDSKDRSITKILGNALIRPFRMLLTQPIIQAIAGMKLQTVLVARHTNCSSIHGFSIWHDVSHVVDLPYSVE
jgi:hypothetical protein